MPSVEVNLDQVLGRQVGLEETPGRDQEPIGLIADRDVAVLAGQQPGLPQPPATQHDVAGGLGAVDRGRRHPARRKTTCPRTIVASARPRRRRPAKGVLRLLEKNRSGSTVHSAPGSMSTTSAGAPLARVPPGRPKILAGRVLMRSTSDGRSRSPPPTSSVIARPSAVSSPMMPFGASSNSRSFAS